MTFSVRLQARLRLGCTFATVLAGLTLTIGLASPAPAAAAPSGLEQAHPATTGKSSHAARKAKKSRWPVASFFRYSQGWNPVVASPSQEAANNRIITLQASSVAQHDALRATGANTKLLFYRNALETIGLARPMRPGHQSTGVDYYQAYTQHPEWFLRNRHGVRITRHYTPTQTNYMMDIGSRSYQAQVVADIIAEARAGDWDGVLLDDVLPTARYWIPSGRLATVAKYPTDKAFSAAFNSFVKYVGIKVRAAGLMVIASTCCSTTYHQRAKWARWLSGTMDEGFVNPTTGPTAPLAFDSTRGWHQWRAYLAEIRAAERGHRILLAITTGLPGNAARARYGLATVLLAANGQTSYSYHPSDRLEWQMPDQAAALQLGPPVGSYVRLASGVFKRTFQRGVVLVNPQEPGHAPVKLSLGGRFSGSGLTRVVRVSMKPVSALILLRG